MQVCVPDRISGQKRNQKQLITLKRKQLENNRVENNNKKISVEQKRELERKLEVSKFLNKIPDEASSGEKGEEDYKNKKIDDKLKKTMQNRNSFPTLAKVSLRYGASSRMTAALATAVLVDVGLVTEDDSSLVIDHHHIQRDRKKVINSLSQDADARHRNEAISCIFFDGRKNWTNVMEEDPETGHFYQSRVKMEHIVVTIEPGGEYLFHFTARK